MYCIDTEALVFMFNGGSPYGFTIHHINNEKHVHHGFQAPRPYLCSTSLIVGCTHSDHKYLDRSWPENDLGSILVCTDTNSNPMSAQSQVWQTIRGLPLIIWEGGLVQNEKNSFGGSMKKIDPRGHLVYKDQPTMA